VSKNLESTTPAATATIAERIELGRTQNTMANGGIVPFPPRMSGRNIVQAPDGGAFHSIQRLLAGGFKATVYEYKAETGETIQAVLRFDHSSEQKEIKPIIYAGKSAGGGDQYLVGAIKGHRPLYGLDRLAARPDAPVLVVEGEKTADAAAKLFPDHVVTTWMSGAGSVHRTEMIVLAGRSITLWPDNDEPGRRAMMNFAAFAFEAGAASINFVDVPPELGEKWDLADDVPPGYETEQTIGGLLAGARNIAPAEVAHFSRKGTPPAAAARLLGHKPGYSKVKIEDVETALSLLDPSMGRNQWIQVARCLFYAFEGAGAKLFDNWSKGSEEKYRVGEPNNLWQGFSEERHFKAKPLSWLFRLAAKALKDRNEEADGRKKGNVELDVSAIWLSAIEELNENHAVVVRGGKTAVLWEHFDPRFERYAQTYLSKRDFIDRHVHLVAVPQDESVDGKKKDRKLSQGAAWFGSVYRKEFDGVSFSPGRNLGPSYLNLWRGFAVEPTNNPEGWSHLKHHLYRHVAGGDEGSFAYLLDWMAWAVQHLDRPIGTALVLLGKKGSGKSIVTEFFGYLFGQHAFVTSRLDDVLGRFNDRLETTSLLGLEEAVAPSSRSADGVLKDVLTRSTLRLEGKFFGVWDAPNHLRVIVTSNNEHVVRADGSERRYAVFDVVNPHQSNPDERRRYFGKMVQQMESGGYGAMLGELLNRDVSRWNAEAMPDTLALQRQKQLSLSNDPVQMYLYERLVDGIHITTGDAAGNAPVHLWSDSATVMVPVRDLAEDFRIFAERNGLIATDRQLALNLPKYMPDGFGSKTRRPKPGDHISVPHKAYPIPPLEDARRLFELATNLSIPREPGD